MWLISGEWNLSTNRLAVIGASNCYGRGQNSWDGFCTTVACGHGPNGRRHPRVAAILTTSIAITCSNICLHIDIILMLYGRGKWQALQNRESARAWNAVLYAYGLFDVTYCAFEPFHPCCSLKVRYTTTTLPVMPVWRSHNPFVRTSDLQRYRHRLGDRLEDLVVRFKTIRRTPQSP